jgi:hypothetical protein
MIQQSISEKIKNVNLLQKEDLNIFYELKNKHPFAEIFQLIHLQLVKKYDSFSFEEELGSVAYKIRDRHKLSSLLQESLETIIEPIIRNQEIITINEQIEILPEETKEELELVKENNIHSESKKEEELDVESANLNTQIAAEAFSTIFSKDFEPTIQFNLEEDHDKYTTLSDRLEIDSKNTSQIENKQPLFQEKSQKSFTSWLKSNKKVEKTDQTQIIETIIATNPSITRPKKEFYNPTKQAIKSVEDDKLVYTETLAKILDMQGNFSKAIAAYEQLSLTIPEKKTYFAKKIKELNEKLNTK